MKTNRTTEAAAPKTETPTASPSQPTNTAELLKAIIAAATEEDALKIVQPNASRPTKKDTIFEVIASENPLPKRRGLMVVYVTAARLQKPFKIADIQATVPNKGVPFWVRQLAKDGHFREVAA